jgi:hypothetical protein
MKWRIWSAFSNPLWVEIMIVAGNVYAGHWGGNGKTRFSDEDAPEAVALIRPYVYTTTTGYTCAVTPLIHSKIQKGQGYSVRGGQGELNQQCSFEYRGSLPKVAASEPKIQSGSKAQAVRDKIAEVKSQGGQAATVVQWAVSELGMTAALAKTYVKNNW